MDIKLDLGRLFVLSSLQMEVISMLCQFSFTNFRSYRDETTFDFQAYNLSEFNDSLIVTDKASDVLPVSVIYGPNGGGKTNLLAALSAAISLVVSPVYELEKTSSTFIIQQKTELMPYMFDDTSKEEPTEFQLFFRVNNNEYRYYIAVLNSVIVSESLYRKTIGGKKPALLFNRENGSIEVGPTISSKSINTSVNPKMPYVSFLAINYSIPVISEVMGWFESCIIRSYANPVAESQILLTENEDSKKRFINMMNDMGIEISGYRYDKENEQFLLQRIIGDKEYDIPFINESDGTRKLFAALPVIIMALREGRLIIIDELDAKLHPKLLRYVIKLFTNPEINRNGAQLLFTSHDLTTMKNTVFRRDEIWFAALNDENSSEIFSLYDIRREDNEHVNNTAAYDKQYLEGRYGADPYLRNMLSWEALDEQKAT